MDFVVNELTWRWGGKPFTKLKGPTYLLNANGYRCCLGFCLKQLGIDDRYLLRQQTPASVGYQIMTQPDAQREIRDTFIVRYTSESSISNSEFVESAMAINDDETRSKTEIKQQLTELFTKFGHTLTFINDTQELESVS